MAKKLIGRGQFTKAYLREDGKVELVSKDPIKECMALGWFPSSRLFPTIDRIDTTEDTALYLMKYYPKVKSLKDSLKPKEYAKYKELRGLTIQYTHNKHNAYQEVYDAFKSIKNKRLRETMQEAIMSCTNYGTDIAFEISPRNVAVSPTGNLVLLDCFFQISKLRELVS